MADSMILKAILQFDAAAAIQDIGRASVSFERLKSNANRVQGGVEKFGGSMGKLALGFTPVALGMGMAVKSAAEFEQGIAMIGTIANQTELPQAKLENTTLALSMAYGTAPTDQVAAFYQAVSSGADTSAKALAIMDTSNRLATAGGAELMGTLNLMGTIMNTYGEQGLSAAEASDVLFQSTNYGIYTIEQLGASMGDVIPTAASLGVNFTDLNAAMATVTLRGATASEAATGLNMALVNVLKPTKSARDEAKKLGLQFDANALKSKGLVGFFNEVVKKTGGSEEAMTALFGSVQGFKVAMKLTANEGELYNETLAKMQNHSGATDSAFQKMSQTMNFQMKQMNATRQVAEVLFGQVLEDSMLRLMSPLAGVATGFVDILQAVKTGDMKGLGPEAAAVANGIRDGLDTVREGIDWIVKTLGEAKKWFTDTFGAEALGSIAKWGVVFAVVAAAIVPVGAILAGLGFIIPAIIAAVTGLGAVLSGVFGLALGPIGILVAVVYLFRDQLYQVFQGMMDVVDPVFSQLKAVFDATFGELGKIFSNIAAMWGETAGSISVDWRMVGRVIGLVLGDILIVVAKVIGTIAIFIADCVQGFIGLGQTIGNVMGAAFLWVMQKAAEGAGLLVKLMTAVGMTPSAGLVAFSKEKFEQPKARNPADTYVNNVKKTSEAQTKSNAEGKTQERGALSEAADEARAAAEAQKRAAAATEALAKKKPGDTRVNVDGREVARAHAKAANDIEVRSGSTATPWQRERVVVHGSTGI